jgi:hypothetical protein
LGKILIILVYERVSPREEKMDKIRSKWEFLLQCKPDVRDMIGNAKLIGGHLSHNGNHEKLFHFITTKGSFSYN